ncbi:MAG: site-2 protease family protein, partial [Oscillospiraceae bacterium]
NPLRHIDPFGALMMLLVGFGWAKPVPVDMRYFKKPKAGMAITALAGPFSNFILAYVALLIAYLVLGIAVVTGALASSLVQGVLDFCSLTASLSIGLGVFNLIPFPPLDGSKVVGAFLPDRIYYKILRYEFAGTIVLMALLWLGVLDGPLYAVRSWLTNSLMTLAQWPLFLIAG